MKILSRLGLLQLLGRLTSLTKGIAFPAIFKIDSEPSVLSLYIGVKQVKHENRLPLKNRFFSFSPKKIDGPKKCAINYS